MCDKKNNSRRNFIKQSSLGLGAGVLGTTASLAAPANEIRNNKKNKLDICIASIDLKGLKNDVTIDARVKGVIERMEGIVGIKPDIICLPELFSTMWVQEQKLISEIAEDEKNPGPVTGRIAAFAKKNSCYVVCPIVTKKDEHFYNSSLLIDRNGSITGVYHKTYPVKSEIIPDQDFKGGGITPGALDQPVIQTDFGKVGMQICYDANWAEGWNQLKEKGAELVLFSSAFPGGRMLNYYALKNNYYIVSATGEDARIIDISGNDLDITSDFVRYAWAEVNLEKFNVTTWPTNDSLPALFKKYGNRLKIKVWDNADVITIESRDPMLKVKDVLKEFSIPDYTEFLKNETALQNKYRL